MLKPVDQQQAVDLRRVFHRPMRDRREGGGAVGISRDRDRFARIGGCRRAVAHRPVVHLRMVHRRWLHRAMVHLRVVHRGVVHAGVIRRTHVHLRMIHL